MRHRGLRSVYALPLCWLQAWLHGGLFHSQRTTPPPLLSAVAKIKPIAQYLYARPQSHLY